MNTDTKKTEFQGLRGSLWPIHNYELKKFLPLALMMFCILFNYTILRNAKDTLVVNAPGSGAEVLPFLKFWAVTPAALLFVAFYVKMSNIVSRETLFYITILPFLVFFGCFAFFIFPNHQLLHPSLEQITDMQMAYPRFKWFIAAFYGNWSYSLFYVLSELWGSALLSLLLWQFANEITRPNEAKRFYPLMGLLSNLGLIFSSILAKTLKSQAEAHVQLYGGDVWDITFKNQMLLIVLMGVVCILAYWWANRYVLTNPFYYDGAKQEKKVKGPKPTLMQSIKFLLNSKYLGYIALIVVAYGITINLCEGLWKAQIKDLYENNKADHNAFMNELTLYTGMATIIMMLIGGNIMRRFKWRTAALLTPITTLVTGGIFFIFMIYQKELAPMLVALSLTPLILSVLVGQVQNVTSKSVKYSLFDPTKEMAYIPLDQESKVRGKAAVDVIGGRAGKSGGALIQQVLLLAIPGATYLTIAPYVVVLFAIICFIWIKAVNSLSVEYEAKRLTTNQL